MSGVHIRVPQHPRVRPGQHPLHPSGERSVSQSVRVRGNKRGAGAQTHRIVSPLRSPHGLAPSTSGGAGVALSWLQLLFIDERMSFIRLTGGAEAYSCCSVCYELACMLTCDASDWFKARQAGGFFCPVIKRCDTSSSSQLV